MGEYSGIIFIQRKPTNILTEFIKFQQFERRTMTHLQE